MNFLRLSDPLLTALYEDDDILAIDKPYGFNAHTNDSKILHSDWIQDGLIEIYEKQLERKLHIIHRLDQTTTGVMIFGKSAESAKKYAEFFFQRQVQKTYLFVTAQKSKLLEFSIDQKIIHKGKELEAQTEFQFLKRSDSFELWKAQPHTGRNHQIRIHALAAELSILGDPKYLGAPFPFLCLHNHKIEFPNGIVIESRPPLLFENLHWFEDEVLAKLFFQADRRLRLYSGAVQSRECFRYAWVGATERMPALIIEKYGELLVCNWPKESWNELDRDRLSIFSNALQIPLAVKLPFMNANKNAGSPPAKYLRLSPAPEDMEQCSQWTALEHEMNFAIRTDVGAVVGPPTGFRLQRNWLFQNCAGKTVLSLFSQTGASSLAAAKGSALQVTSVELSKNFLAWSKKNFELNHLDPNLFQFFCRDSLSFLEQCRNKEIKFDIVVCESPTFYRREKGVFKIDAEVDRLLALCIQCLNPKGKVLFSTTSESLEIDGIRKRLLKIQKDLQIQKMEMSCILPSLDFELPDEKALLKSFLIQIG